MDKAAIKNFAINARRRLIDSVKDKAGSLGITENECAEPLQKGEGYEVYRTQAGTESKIFGEEIVQRANLVKYINEKGYENVIEEVAYTWFNRIIAIRFMEVNNYLPTKVRVLSSEVEGKIEPDIINESPDVDLDFLSEDVEYIITCKSENRLDELFRFLFIKQCNSLGEILPELFEKTKDYTEMLLDISYINEDDVVRMLVDCIEEDDFKNAVEIIGWMYQYYNDERKNEVVNINKSIVNKDDIPAATQLFTTDWIVRYMVDNSLGKYWIERNPNSSLKDKLEFYIEPKEGETYIDENVELNELTFLDDCMGSGHILVYAFDVFMEIYKECGYTEREASINIVENNIYGLDIDKRAYQLAYFAIMMKARSYNRRIFSRELKNNLAVIEESNNIELQENDIEIDIKYKEIIEYLVDKYIDAKQIGSLQVIEKKEYDELENYINQLELDVNIDLVKMNWLNEVGIKVKQLIRQAKIMEREYCVVVTNPPYLNKYTPEMKKFVNKKYKEYSGDLFSVFIYRNLQLCKEDGYTAFMTPFVWMFIKTYEKLRKYIIENKSISSLIQLEYSAFEEATVPICTFVLKNNDRENIGTYIKLSDFKGGMEVQKDKVLEAINKKCKYIYIANQKNFNKIPGIPIAYWVNSMLFEDFEEGIKMDSIVNPKQGLATANNNRFLRLWWEPCYSRINFNVSCCKEMKLSNFKWVPYNKGGERRQWYGNYDYIVNWRNNGEDIKNFKDINGKQRSVVRNPRFYFKPSMTWTDISSGKFSIRYRVKGSIHDVVGMSAFSDDDSELKYLIGLLGSKLADYIFKILNPTIHLQIGDFCNFPVLKKDMYTLRVINIVNNNIYISKTDWDSFETSWDFIKHPLITFKSGASYCEIPIGNWKYKIEDAFNSWKENAENNFNLLKANEEELNRIFIDIYGLQDKLTPEVEDKDVTIRKADLNRDIRSFVSYAVGCMFGRYSIDEDGLIYAGGEFDDSRYKTYSVSKTNIIPITDNDYFNEEDIVNRFVEFVKVVYGEKTLEENLKFIAEALGNKGNSSREIIRNYFIKDFFKDHCKTYQVTGSGKRPIYWLFDSGKENGFKALIYMHRYDKDTVGRVRTEYLHKTQAAIENGIMRADHIIENATNPREKAAATKAKNKYIKQLAETRLYDEAIAHIANERIEIDLDDGVKVNYEKFQGVEVSQEGKKTIKVDLLAKIK